MIEYLQLLGLDTSKYTCTYTHNQQTNKISLLLCFKCKHLKSIDVDGQIECAKGHTGKIKHYCQDYEERWVEW